MASPAKKGVFLCLGGDAHGDSLDLKRLRWTAEAGLEKGPVVEVTQACQREGAAQVVRLVREQGLDSFILGACPLAGPSGSLGQELKAAGLRPNMAQVLDLCLKPDGGRGQCQVAPGAQSSLCQALAVASRAHQPELAAQEVSTQVLVVGHGLVALSATAQLRAAGYPVVLLTPGKRLAPPETLLGPEAAQQAQDLAAKLEQDSGVTLLRGGSLVSFSGLAGDFQARIKDREGQAHALRLGAVIMAQGPPTALNQQGLDLPQSPRVMSLSQALNLMQSPAHLAKIMEREGPPRLAILVGMAQQSGPTALAGACRLAEMAITERGGQAMLLTSNLKVAGRDLERISQEARGQGMTLVKFTHPQLTVSDQGQALVVEFQEEILDRPLRQEFDLLAVDQIPEPDLAYHRLATILGLKVGADSRLQPDRVGALPTLSPRGGVLVVGEARGAADLTRQLDEVGQALWIVRQLLDKGEVMAPTGRVTVDRKLCAICLTCVRVCPQGAMGRQERRPYSNPLVCTACGTCASECPMDAIQILGEEDARYQAEISAAVTKTLGTIPENQGQELLVLLCANSAGEALKAARLKGLSLPEGARLVQVPCAGKIDPAMVLEAFRDGFDGVLILACHIDACYSLEGNTWAGYRLEHLQRLLAETGHDPQRLSMGHVAPSQAHELVALVQKTAAQVEALGPNPSKVAARVREYLGRFTVGVDESYTII